VVSYPEVTYNLVAVSVNGTSINTDELAKTLNNIYNPSGITWKVTPDTYTYSGNTDFMDKGSRLLTSYPEAMKIFQNAYSAAKIIDNKTAYLFFFNKFGAGGKNRDADGFMPRGKQFGYLFTQGFSSSTNLYIAAAHELGHGKFILKHTFDNDYQIPTPTDKYQKKWEIHGYRKSKISTQLVDAFVYNLTINGKAYYYWETLQGQFISAGLKTN
jgi:hypothetical protein